MFSQSEVSVFAWFVFFILMTIPVVNVIMWFILILSNTTNKTLKNFLIMQIFAVLIVGGLVLGLGVGIAGILEAMLENAA